jgi:LPXTG-site transpeptidase (sortase) family protein
MKFFRVSIAVAFIALLVVGVFQPVQNANAGSVVVYNAIPATLPANMASVGYQATSTNEFGDYIHLAGTLRELSEVTVTMSTWALQSTYPTVTASTWSHPITLNIYNVVTGTPYNTKGTLIATKTQNFDIPWRPEADPTCAGGTAWRASDGLCYNGLAFNITFDLASMNITLPTDVIIGIAYNTQTRGYAPIGTAGPYNSLNVGASGTLTVGTDDNADNVFLYSTWSGAYGTNWNGGVGGFREDGGWSPYGTVPLQIKVKDGIFPTSTSSVPANGSSLSTGPTQLKVTFSEDVIHDGSITAADYTGNYLLFSAGSNGTFDTVDCAHGVAADDVAVAVNSAAYDLPTFTTTLNINGGTALPGGSYRLLACGTTSIQDSDGYKLNAGLVDSVINFSVAIPQEATVAPSAIPSTGFAPDRFTTLPAQTVAYSTQNDLWLEIPSMSVKTDIVGVPQNAGEWDVTWLGNDAGWLQGSAFPTWNGNSVLTGHVWDADNTPGIFYGIGNLKYGDQVIVHIGNTDYVYSVRSVKNVAESNVKAMFKHEELPWITLVTCKGFDETSGEYLYRTLVRAVLVDVK